MNAHVAISTPNSLVQNFSHSHLVILPNRLFPISWHCERTVDTCLERHNLHNITFFPFYICTISLMSRRSACLNYLTPFQVSRGLNQKLAITRADSMGWHRGSYGEQPEFFGFMRHWAAFIRTNVALLWTLYPALVIHPFAAHSIICDL